MSLDRKDKVSKKITFRRIPSKLAAAAFHRIGPLKLFLEGKCFKIVGLHAARNLFIDFFIHSNITIGNHFDQNFNFFVDFSTHDSNQTLFFGISVFDFFDGIVVGRC